MFTQPSSETKPRLITSEWLDWKAPACDAMDEQQFMTAQQACVQAWKALQNYICKCPTSLFTQRHSGSAPVMLSEAVLGAFATQTNRNVMRLTVDQLCDAALIRMGFIISRDAFGVDITGENHVVPERAT